ncbi:MAG: hypothetical protein ACRCVX_15995 [Shewanella sp.]
MARKSKARKFDRVKRGNKAFEAKHDGLIRNLAKDAGLLSTFSETKVAPSGAKVEVVVGHKMPKRATAEMRDMAASYCAAIPARRKADKAATKRSEWATFKRHVQNFDSIHKSMVWPAFEIWMKQNPAFSKLNPRKRFAVALSTVDKMIAVVAHRHTMSGVVKVLDEVTGFDGASKAVAQMVVESGEYKDLARYIREMSKLKQDKIAADNKAANKDYDYNEGRKINGPKR